MTGPREAPALPSGPAITMTNVGRTYPGPPAVEAVRDVSLTVRQGEFVAITGPSGSGKSTLMNLLGLLDQPTAGRYLLDGIDVAGLPQAKLAALRGQRIGFVFQEYHLLPYRSALENVVLGLLYGSRGLNTREKAALGAAALGRVGLGHRLHALPSELSGGQRQRVAVARALVRWPSLLLCDEPTGNLDSETALAILGLLEELNTAGQTLIVVTHDPVVAARARRQVTIRDGKVSEVPR